MKRSAVVRRIRTQATRAAALRRAAGVVSLLILGTLSPATLAAQAQAPDAAAEAEKAIEQLRSPYCPGLMLEVCPSPQAGALRDSIRDLAQEGRTSDELVEWMIARHGEEWRGVPQRRGRGLLAWLVPPLALLAAGAVVVSRLRRDRADSVASAPAADSISDADRERLAAAMREMDDNEGLDP